MLSSGIWLFCVAQDNAEPEKQKMGDSFGFQRNQPIHSALFKTRHNNPYAELGIRATFTPVELQPEDLEAFSGIIEIRSYHTSGSERVHCTASSQQRAGAL